MKPTYKFSVQFEDEGFETIMQSSFLKDIKEQWNRRYDSTEELDITAMKIEKDGQVIHSWTESDSHKPFRFMI